MSPYPVSTTARFQVEQGDIIRGASFLEYFAERGDILELSRIEFPYVVVLSQSCDLEGDHKRRYGRPRWSPGKFILSVLVAPLYTAEDFFAGQHLVDIGLELEPKNRRRGEGKLIQDNEIPRYHYLELPDDLPMPSEVVVDFKQFFTVNAEYLTRHKKANFVGKLQPLYRERVTQRFSEYLARIGFALISTLRGMLAETINIRFLEEPASAIRQDLSVPLLVLTSGVTVAERPEG